MDVDTSMFAGDRPAAASESRVWSRAELVRDALAVAGALPAASPDGRSRVVLVFDHDRYAFAAALLGTWAAGHVAVLPETARRRHVGPLVDHPEVVEILHDTGAGRGLSVSALLARRPEGAELSDGIARAVPLAGALIGGGARWTADETIAHVDRAIATYPLFGTEVVASTLAPTSLFGVVHGVLAPLRAEAVVRVGTPRSLDRFADSLRRHGAGVLVASDPQRAALAKRAGDVLARLRTEVIESVPEPPVVDVLCAVDAVDDAWATVIDARLHVAYAGSAPVSVVRASVAASLSADDRPGAVVRVDAIPRDENGRVRSEDGNALFGRGPDGHPWQFGIDMHDEGRTVDGDVVSQVFRGRVPADSSLFAGHFPGVPILAGAVQLDALVLPCVARVRPDLGPLRVVRSVKFLERISPGDELTIGLRWTSSASDVSFEVERDGLRATSGQLRFHPRRDGGDDMTDTFRPCAVVPTFDNPLSVRASVEALAARLPVILIDDGSAEAGRTECAALAADGHATLVRFERNRGKGAAVMDGFSTARALGFSHGFQIDADGQHDLGRVDAFLSAAEESPGALILGHPVYDESAPRSRVIGREITNFWVALELGDRTRIKDAMIGFRVYPLAAALASGTRCDRMGFDIEIAVKMARAGVPIVNLPVSVHYPSPADGGVSHFRPLADNLALCALHTRLCVTGMFGALRRVVGGGTS